MGNLLAPLLHQLLLSLVVFAILFIVISALLARSRFGGMIGGLLRVVASYFYSPFIYLRKGVHELADYARDGESRFERSDQYLLRKVLLMLSGALLLVSIGILTVGGVGMWNHARAWNELRRQIGQATRQVADEQAEKARLTVYLGGLDNQWQSGREPLITAYQRSRTRLADSLEAANRRLAEQVGQIGSTEAAVAQFFPNLAQYLQNNRENPGWYVGNIRDQARSAIDNLAVNDTSKAVMHRYVENWYQARMTLEDPRQMGEEELRRVLQPARRDSIARAEALEQAIPRDEARKAELGSEAKAEGKGVLWEPLRAFLRFLLVVWVAGVAIEAIALAVLTAANIQRLRERADGAPGGPPRD
jgi:hypothetical protein